MAYKVVITDADFPSIDPELAVLSKVPAEVVLAQRREPDEVLEAARDADGLLVQYARITGDVIRGLSRCKVIARYGVGVDSIDVAAATAAGIPVCNVRDYCLDEVAEHTLAMVLACGRHLLQLDASVRAGVWSVASVAPRIARLRACEQIGLSSCQ